MKNQKGYTLVEVAIAGFMLVALGGAIVTMQYIISQNQTQVWKNFASVNDANLNVSKISRELRTARAGENGAYTLESTGNNEIIFYSDIDFDGQTERVRYTLSGSNLTKGIIEPTTNPTTYPLANENIFTLTTNVRNAGADVFEYYNGDWPTDVINNPLADPVSLSEVRLVRIFLRLNSEDDTPEKDYMIDTFSQIRVLKDNL